MNRYVMRRLLGLLTVAVVGAGVANAQTIIPERRPTPMPRIDLQPRPPRPRPLPRDIALTVKKHAVDVSITDGVAVTAIDQVFFNPHEGTVEGTYIFPLEDDVALGKFSMFVNGQEVEGKVLSVEEARRTYESIVATMRDPALLEYLGTRMFKARIFPISPKSEVRVRLSYTQMLRAEDGLVRYRYPLSTEKHSAAPVETVSVMVRVESKTAIKSVFSPSHNVAVSRASDHQASASYEAKNVYPDKDFELYYTLSDKEFGMTVLTQRLPGQDGFFLVRIAPPTKVEAGDVLAKDIAFVIDTSGSMAGEKMDQARNALKFCLSSLNKDDRFNIIPFSHEPTRFRDGLAAAAPETIEQARKFVEGLQGSGGTNIHDALLAALADASNAEASRPYLIVFLTDGQPTIGVTDINEILRNVGGKNAGRVRLFVFGVGDDVNTHLLDLLAEQNRGARDYVTPHENLELKLSSFYRKVSDPVLADLSLSFGGLNVYDLYPRQLGDLFAGSELVVAGRYSGDGTKAVELAGTRRGKAERFVYETNFPRETANHDFLPRLWAMRKVGFLLDEIRLHGENRELKDTIVQLATQYGIVTPYTAYLVTEPGGVAQRPDRPWHWAMERAVAPAPGAGMAQLGVPARKAREETMKAKAGADAVDASMELRRLAFADSGAVATPASPANTASANDEGRSLVTNVGVRTFYRVEDRWIDAAYDSKAETKKVELFSEEYFELVRKHPDLGKCFALGERVVVVVSAVAYETVPKDRMNGE